MTPPLKFLWHWISMNEANTDLLVCSPAHRSIYHILCCLNWFLWGVYYYPHGYKWGNIFSQSWSVLPKITQAGDWSRIWSLERLIPNPNFQPPLTESPRNKQMKTKTKKNRVCFRCPRASYLSVAHCYLCLPYTPTSFSQRDHWSFPSVCKTVSLMINNSQVCLSYTS